MSASDLISHVEQTDSQSDTTVDATPEASSSAPTEAVVAPEIMTPTDSVCEQKLDAYQHNLQRAGANNIVKNHIIASITLGLVPIPLFDLTALTTTQVSMLHSLSEHYQQPFKDRNMKALITALIGGSLPVASVIGLSSFTKLIPGIGSLLGSASLGVAAGATTYAVGQTFIKHFEAGGTIDSFEPKQAKVFFEEKFQEGKAFVRRLKEEVKASSSSNSTEKAEGLANSNSAS